MTSFLQLYMVLFIYDLHAIDGRFTREAKLGETVTSYAKEDTIDNSFIHTMKVEDSDKVCATAKTYWKKSK